MFFVFIAICIKNYNTVSNLKEIVIKINNSKVYAVTLNHNCSRLPHPSVYLFYCIVLSCNNHPNVKSQRTTLTNDRNFIVSYYITI